MNDTNKIKMGDSPGRKANSVKLDLSDASPTRKRSLPILDIIEKFHKIKEERFKPKDKTLQHKLSVQTPRNINKSDSNLHVNGDVSIRDRPKSGTHKLREYLKENAAAVKNRRMSLPSLFHPFTIEPPNSDSLENVETIQELEKDVRFRRERRHSMSHVIQEYSKKRHDELEKLSEEMRAKMDNIESLHGKNKKVEEEKDWFLTGEELHAFYNFWDRPDKAKIRAKLRGRQRLPPLNLHSNGKHDGDFGRPRVFSL